MDDIAPTELRARLIFLFRLLKVDTVFSYDPWGHYEENPDHYVTARAVEAACWMSGGKLDLPEHFAAGLQPHSVSEKYYFARGPQLVNRVVDIAPTFETKLAGIRACRTMIDHMVKDLETSLAERKLRLPSSHERRIHQAGLPTARRQHRQTPRPGIRRRVPLHRPRHKPRALHRTKRRPAIAADNLRNYLCHKISPASNGTDASG